MILKTPFRLLSGFINHFQIVTTLTYYTMARLHNLQSLRTSLLTFSAVSFHVFSLNESNTSNRAFDSHNKSSPGCHLNT
jgi:hypothetical protein